MASLKEVKNRIKSVSSTRKITSAMKLVASSKLHKAQGAIECMRPYEQSLHSILSKFISEMEGDIQSPFVQKRPIKSVVIAPFSSNSSLCGAFNANIIKAMTDTIEKTTERGVERIEILPFGAKVMEKARKSGYHTTSTNPHLLDFPQFSETSLIGTQLMERFLNKEIDEVILIYNHFINTSRQVLTIENLLPVSLVSYNTPEPSLSQSIVPDYIFEPSKEELVTSLIPKALNFKIYTALLDSLASEHSARVIAMQTATDNADDLLHDLTLTYNKTRQAAITTEILDIIGGSFQ